MTPLLLLGAGAVALWVMTQKKGGASETPLYRAAPVPATSSPLPSGPGTYSFKGKSGVTWVVNRDDAFDQYILNIFNLKSRTSTPLLAFKKLKSGKRSIVKFYPLKGDAEHFRDAAIQDFKLQVKR